MDYKYLILDFGKVIAAPSTGHWDVTPKFLELIDINLIDRNEFEKIRRVYGDILSEKVITLDEEYEMFYKFYYSILREFNIPEGIIQKIAYDRTYNYDKYRLYTGVKEELEFLKSKYKLLMLTDNWPCVTDYLKMNNILDFFDSVYISSVYGVEKKDGVFFDYPINDYNINPGEALFIDDCEANLDIARTKDLSVNLMDREKVVRKSKYNIIHNLRNI